MEPSRPNRRRLMQSYIPPRPDVPARFESLIDDTLTTVLQFVGDQSYKSFGGLNKHCKEIYLNTPGMTKETFLFGYAPLSVILDRIEGVDEDNYWELYERVGKGVVLYNRRDVLDWGLEEQNNEVLNGICKVAAEEGRMDLLDEVWSDIDGEDDRYDIFDCLDQIAARHGKLNVLEWLENTDFYINEEDCANEAAENGQLHIIQWLQEEQDLELDGELYDYAIDGNHFHVMKWLRENKVDWLRHTFYNAAIEGNLDILQWLHDESCPWPNDDDYRVPGHLLIKPEVIDWCHVNGYGDRINRRR